MNTVEHADIFYKETIKHIQDNIGVIRDSNIITNDVMD